MKTFVTKADDNLVCLKLLDDSFEGKIVDLGFKFDAELSEYTILTESELDKARLFDKLRSMSINFSGGKEWCPAEVFEYFREKGLLRGDFKKISWSSPDRYMITEE